MSSCQSAVQARHKQSSCLQTFITLRCCIQAPSQKCKTFNSNKGVRRSKFSDVSFCCSCRFKYAPAFMRLEKCIKILKGKSDAHTESTVLYSTVQYSTVQYSTVQYSTIQYSPVQYSTVQYTTVQSSPVQYRY